MTADSAIIFALLVFCLAGGVLATRFWTRRRERELIGSRLESMLGQPAASEDKLPVLDTDRPQWLALLSQQLPALRSLERLCARSGLAVDATAVLSCMAALFILPCFLAAVFDLPLALALLCGVLLACLPVFVLSVAGQRLRTKFCEQLPDAIDLMISVLRSGLSVPQSVKAVGDEMPAPCGAEFSAVLQRMNLGQTLPEALSYSVERYRSFELDLIRRATAIQMEVGGSLAELFEKTNATCRQRLKLQRQVRVLTAQSRLSGVIIGIMPFIIALAFQIMSPGYLKPLFETNIGRIFLVMALLLQITGVIIIRRLSTFKV